MQISKSAWHYRLVRAVFEARGPSRSLCLYFWQVVWSVIFMLAALVVVAALSAMLLSPFWWRWVGDPNFPRTVAFGVTDIVVLCIAWKVYRSELRDRGRLPPKLMRVREPSLLGAWVRAKKQKVCPTLEFVNEHDN